ncbi:hypothetical protein J3A64_003311 [Pseudarthrobacter sp. PvP004]|nr:hypothetical protein [Pseudarthrobacter sp. PvP004]
MAALESGQLNEWRATLLVKETACLSVEDRAAVDEELAPNAGTFDGTGDKAIIAAAKPPHIVVTRGLWHSEPAVQLRNVRSASVLRQTP